MGLWFFRRTLLGVNRYPFCRTILLWRYLRPKWWTDRDSASNKRTYENKKINCRAKNEHVSAPVFPVWKLKSSTPICQAICDALNITHYRSTLLCHFHQRNSAYDAKNRHDVPIWSCFSLETQYRAALTLQHYQALNTISSCKSPPTRLICVMNDEYQHITAILSPITGHTIITDLKMLLFSGIFSAFCDIHHNQLRGPHRTRRYAFRRL